MILQDSISMEQFVLACASWDEVPGIEEVAVAVRDILLAVREHGAADASTSNGGAGPNWCRLMSRMDDSMVAKLHNVFELPAPAFSY
jgi:hypothetical protein